MRHSRIGQASVAVMVRHKRTALALAVSAVALLSGCGGTTVNNPFSTAPPPQEDLPTLTDRFDQLFGGRGKVSETATDGTEVDCPVVRIRAGASTYGVAPPGKQPVASELNYQATITRTARDCRRTTSGQITARIGVQGRVIAGPAGAPASVEVPLRVAIVQAGVNERVLMTKVYRTTVGMTEGGGAFSVVGEDLVFNMPQTLTSDSYVFYVGFDPQAVTPAAPSRRR
ncbi:hypothetical protein [Bradyrhizobium erythrophlei]|jgi:hypothetical protein|uniref:Lipoprotein n=1 Tax=Bradyrhizobium erythrophlei TaxID=1437360 RepID=A0A1M7TM86_9BRAD|nr:hypothetical protein [Bradyrhizobium erythrophlei]SHN71743.1 hypothetical protein SAMN05444170_2098 [Bradyrhizobium erythrophlei]